MAGHHVEEGRGADRLLGQQREQVIQRAGICVPKAWDQVTPEIFDDTTSTNVTGTWDTVTAGAPHLTAAGGGSVILISPAAGLKVQPFMIPYTMMPADITEPADVADTVLFLASDESKSITAHEIAPDAGVTEF